MVRCALASKGIHKNQLLLALLIIASTQLFAQDITIKGKIKDKSTGEDLVGVSIVVKGGSSAEGRPKATATDVNGEFSLTVDQNATIIISYIGFKPKEVKASEIGSVSLDLEQETDVLDEVVVVGYGSADKRDVSSALSKISSKDFNKGVVTGVDALIEGKVAGLQVTQSGEPGGGNNVLLRGVSINGQTPLYVVDGIILDGGAGLGARNPLNFINPNDIADMTVLKDAAATAIYGVRGANGVIQVTTRSGKTGKPVLTYDASVSVAQIIRKPDIMDADEYRSAIRRKVSKTVFDRLGTSNTDWIDEVTRTAISTQHNIGLSGGFKKTNYFVSLGYILNQGVLKKSDHERINLGLKVSQKLLKDNLIIGVNSKVGLIKDQLGPNVFGDAIRIDPTRAVTNPDGSYTQYDNAQQPTNPVARQQYTNNRGTSNRFMNGYNLELKIPFVKGLSLFANGSIDYSENTYNGRRDTLASQIIPRPLSLTYNIESETRINTQYEYFATYKNLVNDHSIEVTAGYGYYDFLSKPRRQGFFDNQFRDFRPNTSDEQSRLISFFARATYNYKGKYFLTASLRRDGSSRFGPGNRWGYFPSASVGWRILDERFAAPLKGIFSELKLRASYGVVGNDQIFGNYKWSSFYTRANTPLVTANGDTINVIRPEGVNKVIRWEQTSSFNAGLDMGFFNGRLTTSIEVYRKNVTDLLFDAAIPAGTNFSSRIVKNIAEVRNQGIELLVNAVPVDMTPFDKNGFKWNLMYNIAYNQNLITKLDVKDNPNGYDSGGLFGIQLLKRKVGDPIDAIYTYEAKKDAAGNLILDADKNGIQDDIEMYKDQNKDGIINESDRVKTGKPNPDVIMGLTSTMSWKKFDFQFTLKSNLGGQVYNGVSSNGYYNNIYQNDAFNNLHNSVLTTKYEARQALSSYYVQNADFLKLTNVTLGYTVDQFKFMNLRAYVTAQNLLFITPYTGIDPEINGGTDVTTGIDNNIYPRAVTFTFGISATFK